MRTEIEIVDGEDIGYDEDKQYVISCQYDDDDNLIVMEVIDEINNN